MPRRLWCHWEGAEVEDDGAAGHVGVMGGGGGVGMRGYPQGVGMRGYPQVSQ